MCVEDQVNTWTPAVTDTKPALGVCGRSGELMDTSSHRHKASTWCVEDQVNTQLNLERTAAASNPMQVLTLYNP